MVVCFGCKLQVLASSICPVISHLLFQAGALHARANNGVLSWKKKENIHHPAPVRKCSLPKELGATEEKSVVDMASLDFTGFDSPWLMKSYHPLILQTHCRVPDMLLDKHWLVDSGLSWVASRRGKCSWWSLSRALRPDQFQPESPGGATSYFRTTISTDDSNPMSFSSPKQS